MRYVASVKAAIVRRVQSGQITRAQVLAEHSMSEDEFSRWERLYGTAPDTKALSQKELLAVRKMERQERDQDSTQAVMSEGGTDGR